MNLALSAHNRELKNNRCELIMKKLMFYLSSLLKLNLYCSLFTE